MNKLAFDHWGGCALIFYKNLPKVEFNTQKLLLQLRGLASQDTRWPVELVVLRSFCLYQLGKTTNKDDWLLQLWCRALLSNSKILSIPGKDQMAI
jgi:hypothetical protein